MVNVENMQLWVEALESGDYQQCVGALHKEAPNEWCCLGVACDVAAKAGIEIERRADEWSGCEIFDDDDAHLPESVQNWLGLENMNPVLAGMTATSWNDDMNANFDVIAQLIRHKYKLPVRPRFVPHFGDPVEVC